MRLGLKGKQEMMCSDGDVYGRNQSLFHLITGDWEIPLGVSALFCPRLVQAVQAGSSKAASFNRRKT